jgi:alkylation response protein AidB-like acyl-CoA dehydrogenase
MSQQTTSKSQTNIAGRSMQLGLKAVNAVASSPVVDRLGIRSQTERLLNTATKHGARTATRAGRTFTAASKLGQPARQPRTGGGDLFDLTPDDEQQMLVESVRDFALAKLRPAALKADAACETPGALLAAASELGLTMIGVPESLGGALEARSAVTTVLMSEALAQGDLGIAVACLAPAAVSTAISLWGDADQQATYLPPFVGASVPAAALAIMEPRPLFDPLKLRTTATKAGSGYLLSGVKSLVPLANAGELFVVAAALDGTPALFVVESATPGIEVVAERAMGLRPAATGSLTFTDVELPGRALLGGADPSVYAECIALGRVAWAAVAAGCGRAVLDYVKQYVNERTAFGEPISNRQAVAFMVSNIAIELDGIRLSCYRAAGLADAGKEFAREAALARRLTSKYAMEIGSSGVQLLGGHGYTKEHPVERWYRDLRAAGLMEGALLV